MGIFGHDDVEPSSKTVQVLLLGRAGRYLDENGVERTAGPYMTITTDAETARAAIANKHAVLRNSDAALKILEQFTPDFSYQNRAHTIDLATEPEIAGVKYHDEAPRRPNLHDHYDRYSNDKSATAPVLHSSMQEQAGKEPWVGKERTGTATALPRSVPRY
jgi:hypothetical protein